MLNSAMRRSLFTAVLTASVCFTLGGVWARGEDRFHRVVENELRREAARLRVERDAQAVKHLECVTAQAELKHTNSALADCKQDLESLNRHDAGGGGKARDARPLNSEFRRNWTTSPPLRTRFRARREIARLDRPRGATTYNSR